MNLLFIFLITISISINFYQFFKYKKDLKNRPKSEQLTEFLADLMAGKVGIFSVQRINSDDILLRSPRNR